MAECPGSAPDFAALGDGGSAERLCRCRGKDAPQLSSTAPSQPGSDPHPAKGPPSASTTARGSVRASADSGLLMVMCKGLSQQLGPCSLASLGGGSCGPHTALQSRSACHQQHGQGRPASASSPALLCHHLSPRLWEYSGQPQLPAHRQWPVVYLVVREIPKQPCQLWVCSNAYCCERGSAPVWNGGQQQILCAGSAGSGYAHTCV